MVLSANWCKLHPIGTNCTQLVQIAPNWCKLHPIGTNCARLVQIAPNWHKLRQPTTNFFKISDKWLWHFCLIKYYICRYNSPCAIFLWWFPIGFVVNCGTGSGPNSGFVGYCLRVAVNLIKVFPLEHPARCLQLSNYPHRSSLWDELACMQTFKPGSFFFQFWQTTFRD